MASVNIVKKEYKGWKNCIYISNSIIDLIVTTDIGPRIIRFGFSGKNNEFCEVENQLGNTGGNEWLLYGGHRLWHSPEVVKRTWYPDNEPVEWTETSNGIKLTPPIEKWSLIKKEMDISISPESTNVKVIHRLTNTGAWTIGFAVWALTVMAPGGREIIPQVTRDTGVLPNRMLSLWPYTKMNDPRAFWGEKYIMVQQDTSVRPPFKIGLPNEDGWAAYANNGHLFVKKYKHIQGAQYPDYASSYETYTNDIMLEMETLSPLIQVEPGQTIEHTEEWSLFDNIKTPESEREIDEIILPLVK